MRDPIQIHQRSITYSSSVDSSVAKYRLVSSKLCCCPDIFSGEKKRTPRCGNKLALLSRFPYLSRLTTVTEGKMIRKFFIGVQVWKISARFGAISFLIVRWATPQSRRWRGAPAVRDWLRQCRRRSLTLAISRYP